MHNPKKPIEASLNKNDKPKKRKVKQKKLQFKSNKKEKKKQKQKKISNASVSEQIASRINLGSIAKVRI